MFRLPIFKPRSRVRKEIEPNEYFENIMRLSKTYTNETVKNTITGIKIAMHQAERFNQKKLVETLNYTLECLMKYESLLEAGFKKYIYIEDIKTMIGEIVPKDSIKFIELERYMRLIPPHIYDKYETAQRLNVFGKYYVMFTDYCHMEKTNVSIREHKIMLKNRDPILFGQISKNDDKNPGMTNRDPRLFVIGEWEDDQCDLTFNKMIDKMQYNKILSGKIVQNKKEGNIVSQFMIDHLIENNDKKR